MSDLPNARASQAVTEVVKECAEDFLFGKRISVLVETVLEEGVVEAVWPIASEVYYNAAVSRCVYIIVLRAHVGPCDTLCSVRTSRRKIYILSWSWSAPRGGHCFGQGRLAKRPRNKFDVGRSRQDMWRGSVVAVVVVVVFVLVAFLLSPFLPCSCRNAACASEHVVA